MKRTSTRITLIPLTDEKAGRRLFALCFVTYFLLYCGRLNYSAALTGIVGSGMMERDTAGLIHTAFFICYGIGQLINGILADRLPPFSLVGIGFFGAGLSNLAMYAAVKAGAPFALLAAIWSVNGYLQSALWPTMLRIVSGILPERQRLGAGVNMMATTAVGTVAAYLMSAAVMRFLGWQESFLVPGLLLIAVAAVWMAATRRTAAVTLIRTPVMPTQKITAGEAKGPLLPLLLSAGILPMLLPIAIFSIVKESMTVWTPTIVTEIFTLPADFAVAMSSILPLIGFFGAGFARLIMEKWLGNEMKTGAVLFGGTVLFVLADLLIGHTSPIVMITLKALAIACLLGVNTVFSSLVPLRFARYGRTATVAGSLNAAAAISGGLSAWLIGLVTTGGGWDACSYLWLGLSLAGGIASLLTSPLWSKFCRQDLN